MVLSSNKQYCIQYIIFDFGLLFLTLDTNFRFFLFFFITFSNNYKFVVISMLGQKKNNTANMDKTWSLGPNVCL